MNMAESINKIVTDLHRSHGSLFKITILSTTTVEKGLVVVFRCDPLPSYDTGRATERLAFYLNGERNINEIILG